MVLFYIDFHIILHNEFLQRVQHKVANKVPFLGGVYRMNNLVLDIYVRV